MATYTMTGNKSLLSMDLNKMKLHMLCKTRVEDIPQVVQGSCIYGTGKGSRECFVVLHGVKSVTQISKGDPRKCLNWRVECEEVHENTMLKRVKNEIVEIQTKCLYEKF